MVDVHWQNLVLLVPSNKNVLEIQLTKYPSNKIETNNSILKAENTLGLIYCVSAYSIKQAHRSSGN
jgi:hypothetical protein